MKKVSVLFMLLCFSLVFGQQEIQVTKNSTVLLLFPEPVTNHIIGDIYEYVIYENEGEDPLSKKMVKLGYNINGRGKSKTNLSIITEDGLLYEFILSYTDTIPKLTYQIAKSEAKTNIAGTNGDHSKTITEASQKNSAVETIKTPSSSYTEGTQTKAFDLDKLNVNPATVVTNDLYAEDKETYIYLQCKNTQFRKKRVARTFDKAYNVTLRLKTVNYDKDELYVYLTLENNGVQAYDVDFIKFVIATVKKGKRTDQEPPHIPPYIYNIPNRIKGDQNHHFVVVFNKFPLSRNKELQIEIREKNGVRNLVLPIDHSLINNPLKF